MHGIQLWTSLPRAKKIDGAQVSASTLPDGGVPKGRRDRARSGGKRRWALKGWSNGNAFVPCACPAERGARLILPIANGDEVGVYVIEGDPHGERQVQPRAGELIALDRVPGSVRLAASVRLRKSWCWAERRRRAAGFMGRSS